MALDTNRVHRIAIEDDKEIKPAMEPQEYDVGEKPERFDFKE